MKHTLSALFITCLGIQALETLELSEPKTPNTKMVLRILEEKCNVCHQTKNPSKIFTKVNIRHNAKKINRQVFVWRRMPKGKEIKLTDQEEQILKTWIQSQK